MFDISWRAVANYLEEIEKARGNNTPLTVGVLARALHEGETERIIDELYDKTVNELNKSAAEDALKFGVGVTHIHMKVPDDYKIYEKRDAVHNPSDIEVIKTCLTVLCNIRKNVSSLITITSLKDIDLAIEGCRDALGMDKEEEHKPFITWALIGKSAWASVKMGWVNEIEDYVIVEFRNKHCYKNEAAARMDAKEWAQAEGLEFI